MPLHVPTMFVMVMLATAFMGSALALIGRRRHPDLRSWSGALFLQLLGYVLISLRGRIPDIASIVVANAAITGSIAMYAVGLYRFRGERLPRVVVALPLAVTVAGFLLLIDDYRHRVLLGGCVWVAQGVHLLWLLMRDRSQADSRGRQVLVGAVAVFTAAMVYRVIAVLAGADTSAGLTDATPMVVANYMASLASTALLAIGALTMILERAERTALDSEGRYRKLVESANEGIIVVEGGVIRIANPKWGELTGFAAEETVGMPFERFVHPDDLGRVREAHSHRLAGRAEGQALVARALTKSGAERWFQVGGVAFEWHGRPATLNFVTDVTERREAEERIRDLAFHDALTRLPNRRLFLDRLQLALAANRRDGGHAAIVFMDLDNFKPLNDLHGHAVGDLLLIEVARRLTANLRGVDTASRFGGDEFVVLVTGLGQDEAFARRQAGVVAEKLRSVLAEPYRLDVTRDEGTVTVEHRCTATAGVVVFSRNRDDPDDLLDRADAAMYAAKQAGRNTVHVDTRAA